MIKRFIEVCYSTREFGWYAMLYDEHGFLLGRTILCDTYTLVVAAAKSLAEEMIGDTAGDLDLRILDRT